MRCGTATWFYYALGPALLSVLGCSSAYDVDPSSVEAKLASLLGEPAAADSIVEQDTEDAGLTAPPPDPTKPVGYWRFDDCEAEVSELMDSSSQYHAGERSQTVGCGTGQRGKAVSFDDETALVQVPTWPAYRTDAGVTVAAWVQPKVVHRTQTILRRHGTFALMIHHGRFYFLARLDSGRLASISAPARAGVWTHVAASYDGKQLTLYVNGERAERTRVRGKLAITDTPLLMGNDNAGHAFVGQLDNVWFNTVAASGETILGLTCVTTAPVVRVTPEEQPAVRAGSIVSYKFELQNNNPPHCPAWGYNFMLFSNATGLDSLPNHLYSRPLTTGETVTYNVDMTSSAESAPGRYEFEVWVTDDEYYVTFGRQKPMILRIAYNVAEPPSCFVAPAHELVIRDVSVVDDLQRTGPGGAWTFEHLLRELAPSEHAAPAFTEAFFRSFRAPQEVNDLTLPALPLVEERVLATWPRTATGELDLSRAPLRLLAISNRADLADLTQHKAGEVHLAYGVLDAEGHPLSFTLNFEYALPAQTEGEAQAWSDILRALHGLPFPSESYNQALEAITERIVRRGAAPNGSLLIDIQTNEAALADDGYNRFRVYQLSSDGNALVPVPLAATPDVSLNLTPTLARYIDTHQQAIVDGSALLPLQFEGAPFQAGQVSTVVDMWEAPNIDLDLRYAFSSRTCNGCHYNETHTRFHHIEPREAGAASEISSYLKGQIIEDYISGKQLRQRELTRRQAQLEARYCRAP